MTIEDILQQPNASIEVLSVNLDDISLKEKYSTLEQLLQKISPKGAITIIGLDIYDLAKWIHSGSKTLAECNEYIERVKSLDTCDNIKRFLFQHSFHTKSVRRDNGYYILTAEHRL